MTRDMRMNEKEAAVNRFYNTEISDEVMLDRIKEIRKSNLSTYSTPSDDHTIYDCLSYAWLVVAAFSTALISYGIKSAFILQ